MFHFQCDIHPIHTVGIRFRGRYRSEWNGLYAAAAAVSCDGLGGHASAGRPPPSRRRSTGHISEREGGKKERGRERGEREKEGGKEERTRGVRRNSNARHEEQAGRQAMFLENEFSEVRMA